MNTLERTMARIKARADTQLETAAARLTPKERARREAARNKTASERTAAVAKRRTAKLTTRRETLKAQLAKATERMAKLREDLKACEASIKVSAKGTK